MDEDSYVLEAATTGDGRLVYEADSKEVYPEYHHRDHLGNTRLTFTDRNQDKLVEIIGNGNEVNQIMDFYPFGLQQQGEGVFGPSVESSNRYRYNGKELNEDLGLYDYGARWYDPAIARWSTIDPVTDAMPNWSPYNYTYGNPINYGDPTGMYPEKAGSEDDDKLRSELDTWDTKFVDPESPDSRPTWSDERQDQIPNYIGGKEGTNDCCGGLELGTAGALIATDIVTPDPSDLLPPKWIAYGIGATLIGGYLIYDYLTEDSPVPSVVSMKPADSGKTADEWAKDWGYDDAHDLKDAHGVGSDYDIYRDGKTGKGVLRRKKGHTGVDIPIE